jgi:hypothetical protein
MMPQPSLATQGLSAWLRGPEEPQGLRARSVAAVRLRLRFLEQVLAGAAVRRPPL